MSENRTTQQGRKLIESLVEDLRPVRPMLWRSGVVAVLVALAATVALVAIWAGFRSGLLTGAVAPLYVVANGLLLLLGTASASAVVAMANPQVGSRHDGPIWAIATVALLPIAAFVTTAASGGQLASVYLGNIDLHCVVYAVISSALVAGALLAWLQRGAPVSIEKAGFLLGISAGALGAFAYGLSCPLETMNHLGIWHVLPVLVMGLAGRLVVPHLLRW